MNKAQSQVIEYLNDWHGGFAHVGTYLDGIVQRVAGNVTAYFTGPLESTSSYRNAVRELLNSGVLFLYRELNPPAHRGPYYYMSTEALETGLESTVELVTEGW